jgi:glycine/D-amino acid oxidase-like deaminating enzyme
VSESFDAVVLGGGVVGCATAFHLARLGARVALLERGEIAGGTTAQSSGILRTYYSVRPNVAVARAALAMFQDFPALLEDEEAACGYVRTGYLAVAPEGPMADALRATVAAQQALGIAARLVSHAEALAIHPWLNLDDVALCAHEAEAGFADPYMTATSFARAARRRGTAVRPNTPVRALLREGNRVVGVRTDAGDVAAGVVVSTLSVWSPLLRGWLGGAEIPCHASRHLVASFAADAPYTRDFPVLKDFASPLMLYSRPHAGAEILVGSGDAGDAVADPDSGTGDIPMEWVAEVGEQLAHRLPRFAEHGRFATAWAGLYDTTPDWNPVLGPLPGVEGLHVAFGFSGHGFKLSPMVGRMLAQAALGMEPDLPLRPYRATRFSEGELLVGAYGAGAVS